jgi:hypothetical protein
MLLIQPTVHLLGDGATELRVKAAAGIYDKDMHLFPGVAMLPKVVLQALQQLPSIDEKFY